jgi:hypothetical protein
VVALVGRDDEQRVFLGDPVCGEALEEEIERMVVISDTAKGIGRSRQTCLSC